MAEGVDFLVAGVQKGATTALDHYLRQHPAVQMASKKETHFFDDERQNWVSPDYGRLHRFFDWSVPNVVRGEATPIYTYWPNCLERIHAYSDSIQLVVSFRHPTFRAFSQWRMETSRGRDSLPFAQAIRSGRMRGEPAHRVYSYVQRGFYAGQIARLLALFPRANVLFLKANDLWLEPRMQLDRITSFLRIPPLQVIEREYITPVPSLEVAEIDDQDRRYLDGLFEGEITDLGELTGLDLRDWLDPNYRELIGKPFGASRESSSVRHAERL